jgi:hypothetical protein
MGYNPQQFPGEKFSPKDRTKKWPPRGFARVLEVIDIDDDGDPTLHLIGLFTDNAPAVAQYNALVASGRDDVVCFTLAGQQYGPIGDASQFKAKPRAPQFVTPAPTAADFTASQLDDIAGRIAAKLSAASPSSPSSTPTDPPKAA